MNVLVAAVAFSAALGLLTQVVLTEWDYHHLENELEHDMSDLRTDVAAICANIEAEFKALKDRLLAADSPVLESTGILDAHVQDLRDAVSAAPVVPPPVEVGALIDATTGQPVVVDVIPAPVEVPAPAPEAVAESPTEEAAEEVGEAPDAAVAAVPVAPDSVIAAAPVSDVPAAPAVDVAPVPDVIPAAEPAPYGLPVGTYQDTMPVVPEPPVAP